MVFACLRSGSLTVGDGARLMDRMGLGDDRFQRRGPAVTPGVLAAGIQSRQPSGSNGLAKLPRG